MIDTNCAVVLKLHRGCDIAVLGLWNALSDSDPSRLPVFIVRLHFCFPISS